MPGFGHGPAQEGVGLVGALPLGGQVVAGAEEDRVDVDQADEIGDLDLARLLRLGRLELLLGEDDVLAAAEVVALDDPVLGDLLAGPLVDLLVADPVGRPLLKLVEVDALVRRGRVQADGMFTSPKLRAPFQIVRGTPNKIPAQGRSTTLLQPFVTLRPW